MISIEYSGATAAHGALVAHPVNYPPLSWHVAAMVVTVAYILVGMV